MCVGESQQFHPQFHPHYSRALKVVDESGIRELLVLSENEAHIPVPKVEERQCIAKLIIRFERVLNGSCHEPLQPGIARAEQPMAGVDC
eukprot:6213589-Pleurochrysis_carterae.AAC.2